MLRPYQSNHASYALTKLTPSAPRMSRKAAIRSSAASTRKARLFSRTVSLPEPLAPLHSRNTGVGPGCAAQRAAMAPVVAGSGAVPAAQRSAMPIAPLGKFIALPTYAELQQSDLDLVVAGTRDAIMMVECGSQEVSEDDMVAAIRFGDAVNKQII